MDAPESTKHRYGHIEFHGKAASIFLRKLLYQKKVKLVSHGRGRYGRLLAYVYTKKYRFCQIVASLTYDNITNWHNHNQTFSMSVGISQKKQNQTN